MSDVVAVVSVIPVIALSAYIANRCYPTVEASWSRRRRVGVGCTGLLVALCVLVLVPLAIGQYSLEALGFLCFGGLWLFLGNMVVRALFPRWARPFRPAADSSKSTSGAKRPPSAHRRSPKKRHMR